MNLNLANLLPTPQSVELRDEWIEFGDCIPAPVKGNVPAGAMARLSRLCGGIGESVRAGPPLRWPPARWESRDRWDGGRWPRAVCRLLDYLIDQVKQFAGETPQGDDQTIVVLAVEV